MAAFKMESMPFYPGPFLIDVGEWDNAAIGAYIKLLCYQWLNESLPDNRSSLAKLAGETPTKFNKIWSKIGEKFVVFGEKRLINLKLFEVRKDQIEFKEKLSKSGSSGASKRWGGYSNPNSEANSPANEVGNAKYMYKDINTPNGVDISKDNQAPESGKEKRKKVAPKKERVGPDGEAVYPERENTCYTWADFWNDYDKKVDKEDAYGQYEKLSEKVRGLIREHLPRYKAAQPDKQFRRNPAGYCRKKLWLSEIVSSNRVITPVAPIPAATTETDELEKHYEFNPMQNA